MRATTTMILVLLLGCGSPAVESVGVEDGGATNTATASTGAAGSGAGGAASSSGASTAAPASASSTGGAASASGDSATVASSASASSTASTAASSSSSSCAMVTHQDACDAVGWCWMTGDGCGGAWLCNGQQYPNQAIAPATCTSPSLVVGGCSGSNQCAPLGIHTSDYGDLFCCPSAP